MFANKDTELTEIENELPPSFFLVPGNMSNRTPFLHVEELATLSLPVGGGNPTS